MLEARLPGCKNSAISLINNHLRSYLLFDMKNLYRSLLLVIAGATQKELARQIKYLKVENEILRSRLPAPVRVTPKEKGRLVRFAKGLRAKVLGELVSIVHPQTLLRWIREASNRPKTPRHKRGQPLTALKLRNLILRLAKDTGWGYTRIMGELKKPGVTPPSRNTVKAILLKGGCDPGPQRGEGTWDEFLKQHAASLWQCDFFSRKVITPKGIRQAFVLAFIHVKTRRVIFSPATYQPNAEWVATQAEAFVEQARSENLPVARLMRDRDSALSDAFDDALRRKRVRILKNPFCAPNMNAYIERFVQSIKRECLDHFIVFGVTHLDVLCREYLAHYHTERPHRGRGNELLIRPTGKLRSQETDEAPTLGDIRCRTRLGGLLKSYHRKAA